MKAALLSLAVPAAALALSFNSPPPPPLYAPTPETVEAAAQRAQDEADRIAGKDLAGRD